MHPEFEDEDNMSTEVEAGGAEEEVAVQFEDTMEGVNNLTNTSGGEENVERM